MLPAPHGPVRVTIPLSTAIHIAPRAYYTHFPPPFQGGKRGNRCALHWLLSGGVELLLGTAFMFPAGAVGPGHPARPKLPDGKGK